MEDKSFLGVTIPKNLKLVLDSKAKEDKRSLSVFVEILLTEAIEKRGYLYLENSK